MAHFQLVGLPGSTNPTRLYKYGEGGREEICVHLGAELTLQQWGGAGISGDMPTLYSSSPSVASVSDAKVQGHNQTFVLKGVGAGTAVLNGRDVGTGNDWVIALHVIAGDFQNHTGMTSDLIASNVGRGNDAHKIYRILRLLNNNVDDTNLLNQRSDYNTKMYGRLCCGEVVLKAGRKIFGRVDEQYQSYHIPIRVTAEDRKRGRVVTRDDVRYADATMTRARMALVRRLKAGEAIRVGAVHRVYASSIAGNGALQPNLDGGHYVLIVGCDDAGSRFLYIDPWPTGSQLRYEGGMPGLIPAGPCLFLGRLEWEHGSRGPVLRQTHDSWGSFSNDHFLEITCGPLA